MLVNPLKLLHPSSFLASKCALTLGNCTLPEHVNPPSLDYFTSVSASVPCLRTAHLSARLGWKGRGRAWHSWSHMRHVSHMNQRHVQSPNLPTLIEYTWGGEHWPINKCMQLPRWSTIPPLLLVMSHVRDEQAGRLCAARAQVRGRSMTPLPFDTESPTQMPSVSRRF